MLLFVVNLCGATITKSCKALPPERPRTRGVWTEWEQWSNDCRCMDTDEVIRTGPRNSVVRSRECPCPKPYGCYYYCGPWYDHTDEKECQPIGAWGTWDEWSACSVTRGTGRQTRSRVCKSKGCWSEEDCPVGARDQERACGGGWVEWDDNQWDQCRCRQHLKHTETKHRTRMCNCIAPDPAVTDQNQTTYPTIATVKGRQGCQYKLLSLSKCMSCSFSIEATIA